MEWWPFLIFHRGGLRIKVINNNMRADELPPRRGLPTLWCERNAVAFQNVTDGLVGHFMPEVG